MLEEVFGEISDVVLPTIICGAVITLLFFGMVYNNKSGLLNILGTIPTHEASDSMIHVEPDQVDQMADAKMPDVGCKNLVYKMEEDVVLPSMFKITIDGVEYDGTQGSSGGFFISLEDVKNAAGTSVFVISTKEELERNDEIPYSMIYIEDTQTLFFLESGAYTLNVCVRLTNGTKGWYKVTIPVSSNI